jgi:hypothetical protein
MLFSCECVRRKQKGHSVLWPFPMLPGRAIRLVASLIVGRTDAFRQAEYGVGAGKWKSCADSAARGAACQWHAPVDRISV